MLRTDDLRAEFFLEMLCDYMLDLLGRVQIFGHFRVIFTYSQVSKLKAVFTQVLRA